MDRFANDRLEIFKQSGIFLLTLSIMCNLLLFKGVDKNKPLRVLKSLVLQGEISVSLPV